MFIQARYEYEDESYYFVDQPAHDFKQEVEQLADTGVKIKSEIEEFGSTLIKRLIAHFHFYLKKNNLFQCFNLTSRN